MYKDVCWDVCEGQVSFEEGGHVFVTLLGNKNHI